LVTDGYLQQNSQDSNQQDTYDFSELETDLKPTGFERTKTQFEIQTKMGVSVYPTNCDATRFQQPHYNDRMMTEQIYAEYFESGDYLKAEKT